MTERMNDGLNDAWTGAPDPEAENVLEAFIDYLNARDLDGVAELVTGEVSSEIFGGPGEEEFLQGVSDFLLRTPTLVLTRGDLGTEPVVAAWAVDGRGGYAMLGFMSFTFTESEDGPLIDHVEFVDDPDAASDLLVEEPDPDEIAEWEDWDELDEE